MGRDQHLTSDADEGINELALVDFAGWCRALQGNQAETISSKLAAVHFFNRLTVGFELPMQSLFVKCALQGISRAHAATGTPRRVHRPVSWDLLLQGGNIIPVRGRGARVLWLCPGMGYYCPFGRGVRSGRGRGAPNPLFNTGRRNVLRWQQTE